MNHNWTDDTVRRVLAAIERYVASRRGRATSRWIAREDLTQELYLSLAQNAKFIAKIDKSTNESDIYRSVCIFCRGYVSNLKRSAENRSKKRDNRELEDALRYSIEVNSYDRESPYFSRPAHETTRYWLQYYIGLLPPALRDVMALRYAGFQVWEVASRLHISERTVARRYSKAIDFLRKCELRN